MNVFFVSLGCDKNLVDSENMLGLLAERGIRVTDDETKAEIIVVNTCSFIHDAMDESVSTLLEMASYKQSGSCKALLVTGCLAQRFKGEILEEIPEIDGVFGVNNTQEIGEILDRVLAGEKVAEFAPPSMEISTSKRLITTGGHYEYLKIAEGCNKRCTYCIIPHLRGNYRSIPMEMLIEEAKELTAQGVTELILVAQETTVYGIDLYGKKSLHLLLKKLCEIPELKWIRILYCYPEEIYPELIETMKEEEKICHYLDLPIQHASDRILKKMGRRTSRADLEELIGRLRVAMPDIMLRTTMIAGFPGETAEDHEIAMQFVNDMEFDRLGVFTYSREEGTVAAEMEDQIDEEQKQIWRDELMELQQEVSYDLGHEKIGRIMKVVIDGKVADESVYVGRTYGDAPDVDGFVFVDSDFELLSGDHVTVKITDAKDYDLIGEIYDEYD